MDPEHIHKLNDIMRTSEVQFRILQRGVTTQAYQQMTKVFNLDFNYLSLGDLVFEMYEALYGLSRRELGLLFWGAEKGFLVPNMIRDYMGPIKEGGTRWSGYANKNAIIYKYERQGWIELLYRHPIIYIYKKPFRSFARKFYAHINKTEKISLSQYDADHDFFKSPHNRWRIREFNRSVDLLAENRNVSKELVEKLKNKEITAKHFVEIRKIESGEY